jgi:hypothetical protein
MREEKKLNYCTFILLCLANLQGCWPVCEVSQWCPRTLLYVEGFAWSRQHNWEQGFFCVISLSPLGAKSGIDPCGLEPTMSFIRRSPWRSVRVLDMPNADLEGGGSKSALNLPSFEHVNLDSNIMNSIVLWQSSFANRHHEDLKKSIYKELIICKYTFWHQNCVCQYNRICYRLERCWWTYMYVQYTSSCWLLQGIIDICLKCFCLQVS